MRRASFELFAEELRRKGYSNKKIRKNPREDDRGRTCGKGTTATVTSSLKRALPQSNGESLTR